MSAKSKLACCRRHRTAFTLQQRTALEDVFRTTMYPELGTIEMLTSTLNLEESAIKTWFKNYRVKWRKKQQQAQSRKSSEGPGQLRAQSGKSPEGPSQMIPVKEEETPFLVTAANTQLVNASSLDISNPDPPEQHGPEQLGRAGPSVWDSSWDSQTRDDQLISLKILDPPWAADPGDIDQFVALYALPGDDDPDSLDQYLFPKVPLWREPVLMFSGTRERT